MRPAWLLCCAIGLAPVASADPLTFSEAMARAGSDGPSITARKAAADSARLSIGPAGQLPDPQIAFGLDNYPVSGPAQFTLNRDDMTMLSVGIMQDMPSGAERSARTGLATAEAEMAGAALEISRLEARRAAASAWIEIYFGMARVSVLDRQVDELETLASASIAALASGSPAADSALAARMDAARVADRLAETRAAITGAQAELERWIGPVGGDRPGPEAPMFEIEADGLRARLDQHVKLLASATEIERARAGLGLARAETQPDWSWELAYQRRDPTFGDMVTLGVRFSLPLFQGTRQKPVIEARRADVSRAAAEREAIVREHRTILETRLAERAAAVERLDRARTLLLPISRQRAAAVAAAHGAGAAPLSDAIMARNAETEIELEIIDLEQRLTSVSAMLSLEYGEVAP
ncbi:MAG: TolC family protein [Alphaproteobacteria bacterium]|nr:TolC family protein [Alphaproteobacteria bacterium]